MIKMNSVKEIESAIVQLSNDDLTILRKWFDDFESRAWDKQFEYDVQSGKFDALARQAIEDFQDGKCKEL